MITLLAGALNLLQDARNM